MINKNTNENANNSRDISILISSITNKFVSYMYLGCLGIKEIAINLECSKLEYVIDLAYKYGLLVYIREELSYFNGINNQVLLSKETCLKTILKYTTMSYSKVNDYINSDNNQNNKNNVCDLYFN